MLAKQSSASGVAQQAAGSPRSIIAARPFRSVSSVQADPCSLSASISISPACRPFTSDCAPGHGQRAVSRRSVKAPASTSVAAAVPTQPLDIVIVGGGISGLVTAQALTSKHNMKNFLVTEARERVGGNITSVEGNGFLWEEGPNSFQPNDSMLQIAVGLTCWQHCSPSVSVPDKGPCNPAMARLQAQWYIDLLGFCLVAARGGKSVLMSATRRSPRADAAPHLHVH